MHKSDFVYGNFSTAGYSWCYKIQPINFPTPEKDVKAEPIPGRNGDIVYDYGTFKNVPTNVELVIEAPAGLDFLKCYDKLRRELVKYNGYQRTEDSLFPNEYRLTRVTGIERDQSDTQNGTVTVSLDCKPQRYLKVGETPVSYVGTASKPTYYVIGDFLPANRTLLSDAAAAAGMTIDSTTDWVLIDLSSYNIQANDLIEIKAGTQTFCAEFFQNDPLTATSASPFSNFSGYQVFPTATFASYIVMPRYYNLRMYKNGVLVLDDAAFDYFIIDNQTPFNARPVLKFALKTGSVNDYIGGVNDCGIWFDISSQPDVSLLAKVLTIDAETMDAFCLKEDCTAFEFMNLNKYVKYTKDKIELVPGNNTILLNDNTNGLEITPGYWTI